MNVKKTLLLVCTSLTCFSASAQFNSRAMAYSVCRVPSIQKNVTPCNSHENLLLNVLPSEATSLVYGVPDINRSVLHNKRELETHNQKVESGMPCVSPKGIFSMLIKKPDSTTYYAMLIKK
jgi:hypothetical protein